MKKTFCICIALGFLYYEIEQITKEIVISNFTPLVFTVLHAKWF